MMKEVSRHLCFVSDESEYQGPSAARALLGARIFTLHTAEPTGAVKGTLINDLRGLLSEGVLSSAKAARVRGKPGFGASGPRGCGRRGEKTVFGPARHVAYCRNPGLRRGVNQSDTRATRAFDAHCPG